MSNIERQRPLALRQYVQQFIDLEPLATRVAHVLGVLPEAVLHDLIDDPAFRLALDRGVPGRGRTVWLSCPQPNGNGSRCIVLKRHLADCDEGFAHYVIAHELAPAHLRNGAWGDIAEPEEAADALAAAWGFVQAPELPNEVAVPCRWI